MKAHKEKKKKEERIIHPTTDNSSGREAYNLNNVS